MSGSTLNIGFNVGPTTLFAAPGLFSVRSAPSKLIGQQVAYSLAAANGTFSWSGQIATIAPGPGGTDTLDNDPYSSYTNTFYLDPVNGSDGNTGSSRVTAKKTLQAAVNLLTVGSSRIIIIPTGTVSVSSDVTWPTNTGTSSIARVVLQGDPTATGTLATIVLSSGALLFPNFAHEVDWCVFRKLDISTPNNAGSAISGETALIWYGPDHPCNGLQVEFCRMHDVYGSDNTAAVFFQGTHSNVVFNQLKIFNCYNSGGTSNHNGAGLFTYQAPSVVVSNCDISACGALIYQKRCSPSVGLANGWSITNSKFHDAPGNDAILVSEQGGGDVGGFFNNVTTGNLFYNVGQCVDQNNSENTVQSSNYTFAFNTIGQDVTYGAGFEAMTNIQWHSNVMMPTTIQVATNNAASPNGYVNTLSLMDYNAYFTGQGQSWFMNQFGTGSHNYTTLASWKTAFSVGARPELVADPDSHATSFGTIVTHFPNYTTRDYTIAGGSPLKGAGQGGVDPGYSPANCGTSW